VTHYLYKIKLFNVNSIVWLPLFCAILLLVFHGSTTELYSITIYGLSFSRTCSLISNLHLDVMDMVFSDTETDDGNDSVALPSLLDMEPVFSSTFRNTVDESATSDTHMQGSVCHEILADTCFLHFQHTS